LFEFDTLVRFRSCNVAGKEDVAGRKEKKQGQKLEAWWLKSNFMSLLNLTPMMEELGPLILWWDGGGKGERFIQQIKPHIKKGVRDDAPNFFVGLMEKIYRQRVTELLAERYGSTAEVGGRGEVEETQTFNDALMAAQAEAAGMSKLGKDETEEDPYESDDVESYHASDEEVDMDEEVFKEDPYQFSRAEEEGMLKQSTIYIYRSMEILHSSIELVKPLAGFLKKEGGCLVFYSAYRVPGKHFGTLRVVFDDNVGLHYFGLWYARTIVQGENTTTDSFKQIQESAKTAAIAIPLHYIIGKNKPSSHLYCVITNWWQNRFKGGDYKLPILDSTLYANDGILTREDFMAAEHPENVI
jgi:hypothetical protein